MARKPRLPGSAVFAVLVFSLAFMAMLTPSIADDRAMMLPVDPVPLVAETDAGDRSFTIEIADEPQERSAGLMFREAMDDDHGMLFVFEQTQPVGFWMKNTPLPLDLVFIGEDGRVREIHRGEPFSEALIASGEPVRFVLELKHGTAQRTGVKEGDLVRHPAINSVLGGG